MNFFDKQPLFRIVSVFLLIVFGMGSRCFADYDYINISEPFTKKIPLAVPVFKNLSGAPGGGEIAVDAADLLGRALDFTGYFKIIDRGAYLERPEQKGITIAEIDFKNWTDIGTELLVTGGLRLEGEVLQLEFRLFDPFKGELLLGKRYTGNPSDLRKMVLRFCGEMIFRLTGKYGIFNSSIAFVSTTQGGKTIYMCDFDGSNLQRVVDPESILLFPAWSPDGKMIAYTSYKNGKPDIFVKPVPRGSGKVLVSYKGMNITPVWVPGQSTMAATLSYEGDEEIYLLTPSGKVAKRLTKSWGVDVSPTFSPDGRQMAFVSNRSGSPQIYVMNLDTGQERRLTYEGTYNTQPDWSPAGDRIVYSGMKKGISDIYAIALDGGGPMQLTRGEGRNEAPSWSPDGSLIVFASTRDGVSDIYVMTGYGTDQRRLIEMPGEQTLPAWSPNIGE